MKSAQGILLACLGIALAFSPIACKTAGNSSAPAETYVAPDWTDLGIKSVAFLGVGSAIGGEDDRLLAEQVAARELGSSQSRFLVIQFDAARNRAQKAGATELFDRVVKVWRDRRTVDAFVARDLCAKLGVDAILLGTLSDWKEEKVDWSSEGTSFTELGLGLAIYSGKTGLLAWEANQVLREESEYYSPGASGSGVYTDPAGAQRTERGGTLTPDPPPAEVVARKVMASLIASFPPQPAS